jgi:hypothetical protein
MTEEAKKKSLKRSKHLTAPEKAEAISLWKSGSVTLVDLTKRFGRSGATFQRLFRNEKISKGSDAKEHAEQVAEIVKEELFDSVAEHAKRVREVKERYVKTADGLRVMVLAEIHNARTKKLDISVNASNINTLLNAAKTLRITREETFTCMGIIPGESDDEEDLPVLEIKEITQQEIETIQESMLKEIEDTLGDVEEKPPAPEEKE